MSLGDELERLASMHRSGVLTEDEFARAKARLIDHPPGWTAINAFRRSSSERWIAGVCGGMARATGAEAWIWRLLFTLLFFCGGAGLLIYALLWIFVPSD